METNSGSTILVVDDEPAMCQALAELLTAEGYGVVCASNGADALAQAAEYVPDLVLLDVKMPDMDGFTVCRRLRADPLLAEMPVIMVTSLTDRDSRLRGFEAGADDFISKPIDRPELLARVRTTTQLNRYRHLLHEQTRRQEAEKAAERLQRQNELILNAAGEGIFGLDRQGRHTFVNPAAAHMLGYSVAELLARPSHATWHHTTSNGSPYPEDVCPIYAVYRDGAIRLGDDELFWRKDGTGFPVEYVSTPIQEGGDVVGAVVMFRDITERKRSEQELRRQLEELIVLHTVAIAAAEATDENALIEQAVQAIGRIFYPDNFGVLLLDGQAGVLRAHPSYRALEHMATGTVPLGQGVVGHVAADGRPRRIPDVTQEPIYQAADPRTRSELCVPLRASGQILGVINVESAHRDAFSRADERLLTTFAGQLATAIEKVRLMGTLEQRVADRTEELAALYDVTAVTSEPLDLETVLEQVLERTLEVTGGKAGAIQLVDETGKNLRLAVQKGIPLHVVPLMDAPLADDADWSSRIIERGEPLIRLGGAADPRADQVVRGDPPLPCPCVGVPLQARGRPLGVLSVFGEEEQRFSVEEVALLASIAGHVGVAVESARLRQRAERAAVLEERERLARELHDSVTQWLYSLTLLTEGSRRLARSGRLESVDDCLADLGEISQQALREMRLLIYELRPSALEREGLVGALRQRLEAVEGRAGVEARLYTGGEVVLPPPVEEGLYRIAGEALNNSLKHAAASLVTVHIQATDERVTLEVADNGAGFDPGAVASSGGMGLLSMRERAEKLGGTLVVISAPGQGTRVKVRLVGTRGNS
jgi:PAS domain S-box-containing protein